LKESEKQAAAKARKDRILASEALAKNTQNKFGQKISSLQAQKIRKESQEKLDQNEDMVKLLNTYSQRAVAFAIRDKQIIDKQLKQKEERDYERRMDLAMELDRLKELKLREDRENAKIKKRVEDRKVIEEQIELRRQQKLLTEEERERENQQMLATIKKYQAEDKAKVKKRKDEAKTAQLDVIRRNEHSVEMKRKIAQYAKEEDEKIIAYQKQRDEKLRQRELDEVEERRAKEVMQKKMLANQAKSIDRQAQVGELRARRAMEEKERLYREKELLEARKRKRDMKILHDARKQQEEERRIKIEQERSIKNEEYHAMIKAAADMAQREKDEEHATVIKNEEFRKALQKQIETNESKKRNRAKDKRKEGQEDKRHKVTTKHIYKLDILNIFVLIVYSLCNFKEMELIKLCAVRDKMVADMKAKGVSEKYFGEMKSMDIEKFLMK